MKKEVNMIHPTTRIGKNTKIGMYSVIGYPENEEKYVEIGQDCKIGNYVTICPSTKIRSNVFIDNYSHIGRDVIIDDYALILYGAKIYDRAKVGKYSRIGGFVAENTIIGDYVTVFGKLIHSFRDPTHWGGGEEPPTIDNFVVVGFNAVIIGGIKISHHAYIAAGAVVSKDIPPYSMVYGVNKITPLKHWRGKIKESKFWRWEG